MRYSCALIAVKDIQKARAFYETLFDLEVEQDYGENVAYTCGFALQEKFEMLTGFAKEKIQYKTNNMELVFETDDFDGFLEKLKTLYPNTEFLHDVVEYPWGQRGTHFYDLDGHIIEVGESMLFVAKRFLQQGMPVQEVYERLQGTFSVAFLEELLKNKVYEE